MKSLSRRRPSPFFLFFILFLSLPGFAQEDDETIRKLEEQRRRQAKVAQDIEATHEKLKSSAVNFPLELKKLGHETITAASLMDDKVLALVLKMMKEGPLQKTSIDEVRGLILGKVDGTYMETFLRKNPKVLEAMVEVLRDKEAMPSALSILLRKDDLKLYGVIWIVLLILGWVFKKSFFSPDWGGPRTFCMSVLVGLTNMTLSFWIFYQMFQAELAPTVKILSRYF